MQKMYAVSGLEAARNQNGARVVPRRVMVGTIMSRRKARKLAYQYKGGTRRQRYLAFLTGFDSGFVVVGKRLVRVPKFGPTIFTTLHMGS